MKQLVLWHYSCVFWASLFTLESFSGQEPHSQVNRITEGALQNWRRWVSEWVSECECVCACEGVNECEYVCLWMCVSESERVHMRDTCMFVSVRLWMKIYCCCAVWCPLPSPAHGNSLKTCADDLIKFGTTVSTAEPLLGKPLIYSPTLAPIFSVHCWLA